MQNSASTAQGTNGLTCSINRGVGGGCLGSMRNLALDARRGHRCGNMQGTAGGGHQDHQRGSARCGFAQRSRGGRMASTNICICHVGRAVPPPMRYSAADHHRPLPPDQIELACLFYDMELNANIRNGLGPLPGRERFRTPPGEERSPVGRHPPRLEPPPNSGTPSLSELTPAGGACPSTTRAHPHRSQPTRTPTRTTRPRRRRR